MGEPREPAAAVTAVAKEEAMAVAQMVAMVEVMVAVEVAAMAAAGMGEAWVGCRVVMGDAAREMMVVVTALEAAATVEAEDTAMATVATQEVLWVVMSAVVATDRERMAVVEAVEMAPETAAAN